MKKNSYGGAIVLLLFGAILYWVVKIHTKNLDLHLAGIIFMVAGGLLLVLQLMTNFAGDKQKIVEHHINDSHN